MSLLPMIPEEIREARIGTCYNPIARTLLSKRIAIDVDRLDGKALNFVHASGKLELRANAATAKNAQDTFFAVNSTAKVGSWASLGFGMSAASSETQNSAALNCYCSYVYKDQKLVLLDCDDETLFNYMTDDFKKAYTALVTAPADKAFIKYLDFIKKFGYGCVTELLLTSGSAFEITAQYKDKAKASESKYNAEIGIGTPWGGASVASSFAQKVATADSNASVVINATHLPENTPTKDWCNNLTSQLTALGFSKLSKDPSLITPYTGSEPKTPAIPKGEPSKDKLPKEDAKDISDAMKKKLMEDDGFSGTWEEYKKKQEGLYEELKPKKIVEQINALSPEDISKNAVCELDARCEESGIEDTAGASNAMWDLGGYIPCGYKYKLWHELFPKLKSIAMLPSFSNLYLAKSYMYYMTRLQFANYLSLLADIGESITENPLSRNDMLQFQRTCDNLLAKINETMSKGSFTMRDYNEITASFEQAVQNLVEFQSKIIYEKFFKHYDFFIDNLCGFAAVTYNLRTGKYTYLLPNHNVSEEKTSFSLGELMMKALRFYPVITPKGDVHVAMYVTIVGPKWTVSYDIPGGLDAQKRKDEQGIYYYEHQEPKFPPYQKPRLYGAGEAVYSALKGSSTTALPMVHPFDIGDILAFANPDTPI